MCFTMYHIYSIVTRGLTFHCVQSEKKYLFQYSIVTWGSIKAAKIWKKNLRYIRVNTVCFNLSMLKLKGMLFCSEINVTATSNTSKGHEFYALLHRPCMLSMNISGVKSPQNLREHCNYCTNHTIFLDTSLAHLWKESLECIADCLILGMLCSLIKLGGTILLARTIRDVNFHFTTSIHWTRIMLFNGIVHLMKLKDSHSKHWLWWAVWMLY